MPSFQLSAILSAILSAVVSAVVARILEQRAFAGWMAWVVAVLTLTETFGQDGPLLRDRTAQERSPRIPGRPPFADTPVLQSPALQPPANPPPASPSRSNAPSSNAPPINQPPINQPLLNQSSTTVDGWAPARAANPPRTTTFFPGPPGAERNLLDAGPYEPAPSSAGVSNSGPIGTGVWPGGEPATAGSFGDGAIPPSLPLAVDDDPMPFEGPKLSSFKNGFFQKFSLSATWLAGAPSTTKLGIVETESFVTVAVPFPTTEWPLLITPYLQVRSLSGPTTPELPATLYETYVDFLWVPRISPSLLGIIALTPSVYSDFEAASDDGFRFAGKGLVRWDIREEQLQLLAGVLYLNREDIRLLPAGGIIWRPSPEYDLEFIFPRPKLARRLAFTEISEDWLYVAGEFGGNSFAVSSTAGVRDTVTLRDWRVMIGWERRRDGGAGVRFEAGYVFSRSIEFLHTATPDFHPDNTFLLRLVGTF